MLLQAVLWKYIDEWKIFWCMWTCTGPFYWTLAAVFRRAAGRPIPYSNSLQGIFYWTCL